MASQKRTTSSSRGVRPTADYLEALVGDWELGGEAIRMREEPGTGVLVALNSRGESVNPITVITRGSRRWRRSSDT
ncbi:MAG: hypothetical protein ACWGSQ_13035 [Longimicrobiales bacterium]